MANKHMTDFRVSRQQIENLSHGHKLMLLTAARKFQRSSKAFIDFLDFPSLFISICEEYDQMQEAKYFSEFLSDLVNMSIISRHNVDNDIFITLSDIPACELSAFLEQSMKQKRRDKAYFM